MCRSCVGFAANLRLLAWELGDRLRGVVPLEVLYLALEGVGFSRGLPKLEQSPLAAAAAQICKKSAGVLIRVAPIAANFSNRTVAA